MPVVLAVILAILLELASIIAGEVPTCPLPAKIAVAQVYHNRQAAGIQGGWFGWQTPTPADWTAALTWRTWPDLTDGALYAASRTDLPNMPWLREIVAVWDCAGGLSLVIAK